MTVVDQFWQLCTEAKRMCDNTVDSRQREPAFLAVLKFIQEHPEDRPAFVFCLIHLLHWDWEDLGPFDLIEYCMSELRWQEVQTHLEGIYAVTPEINFRSIARRLLAAFRDPWPTGVIYARYDPRPGKKS
jgi:hypothetical protein